MFQALKLTAAGTVQEFLSLRTNADKSPDSHFNLTCVKTKIRGKGIKKIVGDEFSFSGTLRRKIVRANFHSPSYPKRFSMIDDR